MFTQKFGEVFVYEEPSTLKDEIQYIDHIQESESMVLVEPLRVKCKGPNEDVKTLEMWELNFYSSKYIKQVLD